MNKSELKTMWGKYVDTDKLVDDIMTLLTTYNHRNSEHGVCTMLHTFFTNKEPLIQKFISSPHYIGDLRIGLQKEFARTNNAREIRDFCYRFVDEIGANNMILSRTDKSGKTMADYMLTGVKRVSVKQLRDVEFTKKMQASRSGMKNFDNSGYTKESRKSAEEFHYIIGGNFADFSKSTLNNSIIEEIHINNKNIKLAEGLKTSRAFNRICEMYGVNKAENYNKLFAQYADMVSDLKRELYFYISLNPYDYLTMSFGNSWASCHTIDKHNRRNMPESYSGGYCGGCLSYMLDETSIITFAMDKGADVQQDGKIYRNMFHFGDNMLMQSRVYPQSSDGGTDLYESFRVIVQAELAIMLGLENNSWDHLGNRRACERRTISGGVHYPDYIYRDDCNIFFPTELHQSINSDSRIRVGRAGVCVCCGEPITTSNKISHDTCFAI